MQVPVLFEGFGTALGCYDLGRCRWGVVIEDGPALTVEK